jgi:hypothetical protein
MVEMLSKKQLEDAAKCEKEIGSDDFEYQEKRCKQCSCSDGHGRCAATFEAAQTALAYRAMLERTCVLLNDHFCGDKHYSSDGEMTEVGKALEEARALLKESEGLK